MIAKRLREKIEEYMDELVGMAEGCVRETKIAESELEESQLRNLQNLAATTDSIKALENFVRYQIGRHRKNWGHGEFGDRVLDDFEGLSRKAAEITFNSADLNAVRMELIRLYLGFMVRAFVAQKADEATKKDKEREGEEA